MKLLEERIRKDGIVKPGNVLKVDSFLNHQMDVELFNEMGKEFKRLFGDRPINKILTIEASGIGIACVVAQHFQVPVVFAKKAKSINLDGEMYTTKIESFTHKKVYDVIVAKKFLNKEDHVLIIDDFLANGCAVAGLIDLIQSAGATVEGVGIAIEKGFQQGGDIIRGTGKPECFLFIRVLHSNMRQRMRWESSLTWRRAATFIHGCRTQPATRWRRR